MKRDMYVEGKIYKNFDEFNGLLLITDEEYLSQFTSFPVIPPHSFTDGQEVVEGKDYEKVDELASEVDEYGNLVCNVEGCDQLSCSGGNHYRETGYWCLCTKHANDARQGKPQPKFKDKAIEHEAARDKETRYSTQRIVALPLAQPVQQVEEKDKDGWVNCEDDLPNWGKDNLFSEKILATDGDNIQVGVLFKQTDNRYSLYGTNQSNYIRHVTHWQPLPPPPKN